MNRTIMVVDDDPIITKMLQRFLEGHQFSVVCTNAGSEALSLARRCPPDLILTDATMPDLDGHSLCRALRTQNGTKNIPLILMSGSQISESNVVAGFEGGADDYVLKPLSMPILLAHIEAILRRSDSDPKPGTESGTIDLDPAGRNVKVDGARIALTRKEFDLLAELLAKPGKVLSVPYLLEKIWGYNTADYNDSGTVEAHISRLRKKCGQWVAKKIVNVTGHGYKFDDDEKSLIK